jgi:hypothetical protein
MNAFLDSLKADLLDRRLRALVMLLIAGLLGSLVYALSGGSASAPPPAPSTSASAGAPGIAPVVASPGASQAVAETTDGSSLQRGGSSRDPFAPLPGGVSPVASTASVGKSPSSTSSSPASSSASATSGSAGSSGTGAGSAAPTSKSSKPAKRQASYDVAIEFGVLPAGTPPQDAKLTSYAKLAARQKLPSQKQPLVEFGGVSSNGKRVNFKLLGELILRGSGTCLPSASQCELIQLSQGQSEELEYLPPDGGAPIVYELEVVSIAKASASAARAHKAAHAASGASARHHHARASSSH